MSVILCTAGYDHTIRFWEALSGFCSRQIPHPDSQVNRLCISPNKAYIAAAGREKIKLYSCKGNDPNPILTFEGHTSNVTGIGFHCDAKWMVTSSEDGTVKIWDTKTATVQRNYGHGSPVNDVVIHPNQGELISCDRAGNVRIWDLGENKCSHQLIPEEDVPVASVTVASDGSLLCAGNNTGNVYVWRMIQTEDATSLIPVTKFQAHNTYITRVLLSPDVRILATCSADHTARTWKVELSHQDASPPAREQSQLINDGEVSEDEQNSEEEDDDDDDANSEEDEDDEDSISPDSSPLSPGSRPRSPRPSRSRRPASPAAPRRGQAAAVLSGLPQDQFPQTQGQQQLPLRPMRTSTTTTHMDTMTSTALQHTHAAHPMTGVAQGPPAPPTPPNATRITNPTSTTTNRVNPFSLSLTKTNSTAINGNSANDPFQDPNAFVLDSTLTGHQRWVWDCAFSADSAYLVTACSDHYARLWELSSKSVIRQYNGHHRGAVCVALNDYSEVR